MTAIKVPRLGILMLDTRFPRIPGDIGNPATWEFPVRYSVIKGATPEAIIQNDQSPFLEAFLAAQVADGELRDMLRALASLAGDISVLETAAARLAEVARGHDVQRVVLGNPIHMSGAESTMSQAVGRLRTALAAQFDGPVVLQDERLTSAAAEAEIAKEEYETPYVRPYLLN